MNCVYVLSESDGGDILNDVNVNTLENEDRNKLFELLGKYKNIITFGNAVRYVNTTKFKIDLKNDCIVNYRPYRLSLIERKKSQKHDSKYIA